MRVDERQAADAAQRSEVDIRTLRTVDEFESALRIFDSIWGGPRPFDPDHALAMAHVGNYVAGAYDGDRLIGASFGFFGTPLGEHLHSHITGIGRAGAGRRIGFALKLHQRSWALDLGLTTISWTFDPLIARNAHFNINKLGARVAGYLVDFYGEMSDEINAGQGSDRLYMEWPIASAGVADLIDGRRPEIDPVESIEVPSDIEGLRRSDPDEARAWRASVRSAFADAETAGLQVRGFDRHRYLLVNS